MNIGSTSANLLILILANSGNWINFSRLADFDFSKPICRKVDESLGDELVYNECEIKGVGLIHRCCESNTQICYALTNVMQGMADKKKNGVLVVQGMADIM